MNAKLVLFGAALATLSTTAYSQVARAFPAATCLREVRHEAMRFDETMRRGKADGKIDTKEEADLKKTHADVIKTIEDAERDGKITEPECKTIHAKLVAEHAQLNAAVGKRAGRTCAPKVKSGTHMLESRLERAKAAKKIDNKETIELNRAMRELRDQEKRAEEDHRYTEEECKAVLDKIETIKKQIDAAVAK
jgi:ribosome recycling factor